MRMRNYFTPRIFYDYLLTVRVGKDTSFIFTNVLKRSDYFVFFFTFSLFINGMQESLTFFAYDVTIQYGCGEYSGT